MFASEECSDGGDVDVNAPSSCRTNHLAVNFGSGLSFTRQVLQLQPPISTESARRCDSKPGYFQYVGKAPAKKAERCSHCCR